MFPCPQKQSGQSMIETIVAVAVIAIGLMAAASLAAYAIRSGVRAENRLVATYLAQDGLEIIRSMRSTNWLWGKNAWAEQDFFNPSYIDNNTDEGTFIFDTNVFNPSAKLPWGLWTIANKPSNPAVYFNNATGLYSNLTESGWQCTPDYQTCTDGFGHDWRPTNFKRYFVIKYDAGDLSWREIKVIVTWTEPGGVQPKQEIHTRLYDWKI